MATDRIRDVFGAARVLLPVIHPVEWDLALASVAIAHEAGAPGVFLINQGMGVDEVLQLVLAVRARHPRLWVGVNLLGLAPAEALRVALRACDGRLDGLWSDNAMVDEHAATQPQAQAFVDARRRLGWSGLYFGGVAFKYQRAVADADLGRAATAALPYLDAICTSGPGTGAAADVAKVQAMRAAVGDGAVIALASGVTADNVADYLPYVNAFLVGTGIEHRLGELDPARVAALQQRIGGFAP